MGTATDLETLYAEYQAALAVLLAGRPMPSVGLPSGGSVAKAVAPQLSEPTLAQLDWLVAALGHQERRRWFVAGALKVAESVDERLFRTIMHAAIVCSPSSCDEFVELCVRLFGIQRVRVFLTEILATGNDRQRRSAEQGLYFAG